MARKRAGASRRARRRKTALGPEIEICKRTRAVRVSQKRLRELIEFVARAEGQSLAAIDLAVVNDAEMKALNRSYLRRAGATDVLSFDLSDAEHVGLVAQIVVCGDLAVRQARLRGHSAARELMLYVVHGLLHLMGYDETTVRGAARMHAREDELLAAFGEGPAFAGRPRRRAK
jgi:probable rRNA maturation factor